MNSPSARGAAKASPSLHTQIFGFRPKDHILRYSLALRTGTLQIQASKPYRDFDDFQDPTDQAVVAILAALSPSTMYLKREYRIGGPSVRLALDLALRSGRLTVDGVPAQAGADVRAHPTWLVRPDGTQTLELGLPDEFDGCPVHNLFGLFAISELDGSAVLHRVVSGLPDAALANLHGRVVSPDESSEFAKVLEKDHPTAAPKRIARARRLVKPRPVVILDEEQTDAGRRQTASVQVEYDWGTFAPGQAVGDADVRYVDGTLVESVRDERAENDILRQASEAAGRFGRRHPDRVEFDFGDDDAASARFQRDGVRQFENSGTWTVRRTERWTSDLKPWDARMAFALHGNAFSAFDVTASAEVGGISEDLMPGLIAIVDMIERQGAHLAREEAEATLQRILQPGEHPLRTAHGMVMVPTDSLRRIALTLWMIFKHRPENPGSEFHVTTLAEFADLGTEIELRADERLLNLVSLMREDAADVPPPASLAEGRTLDRCQTQAHAWLRRLHAAGYGGILADEMGVGKTLSVLAHIVSLHEDGLLADQALVSAPKGATDTWIAHMREFFPGVAFHVWEDAGRHDLAGLEAAPIVITRTPLLAIDEALTSRRWSVVALDEAHDQRTPDRIDTQIIMAIDADQKIPVTATPIENDLTDYWTLMQIANPGLLGSGPFFDNRIRKPIIQDGNAHVGEMLDRFSSLFVLAREMEDTDQPAPKPNEHEVLVVMGPEQRAFYEAHRLTAQENYQAYMERMGRRATAAGALTLLTALRQTCCHPVLVDRERAIASGVQHKSAKTEAIRDKALELVSRGKKILVFSYWTSHLSIIQETLEELGIRTCTINGGMTSGARKAAERAFKNPDDDLNVILISTKTGGRSLSFPEADAVFLCDPWWNPQPDRQAIARGRRRGMTKAVDVYRFVTVDSIEQHMRDIIHPKKLAFANVLKGLHVASAITQEDIRALMRQAHGAANDDAPMRIAV